MGMPGAFAAGLLSLLAGLILYWPVHAMGRQLGWTPAGNIARTFLLTALATASVDIWNLFYLGIVPMQSPVTLARVLATIHDPDYLGKRVVLEITGAALGAVVGWLIGSGSLRNYLRDSRSRPGG